jgi:hypothetical protein
LTKHLVSHLRKVEQLALRDEIVDRLNIAKAAIQIFAAQEKVEVEALSPRLVDGIMLSSLNSFGFAPEEVQGVPRTTPRTKIGDLD